MNTVSLTPGGAAHSRWLWQWLPARLRSERDYLFFSFSLLLGLAYLSFSLTSWHMGFERSARANLLAALAMAGLAVLRSRGWPRRSLLGWMQAL